MAPVSERELLVEIRDLLGEIRDALKPRRKQEKMALTDEGLPHLARIWNQWAHEKMPKVLNVSPSSTRAGKAHERWREKPIEDYWVAVVVRMNKSKFCLGENGRKWFANFDFFIRPDTHSRVLEGIYDDAPDPKTQRTVVGYIAGPNGEQVPVLSTR